MTQPNSSSTSSSGYSGLQIEASRHFVEWLHTTNVSLALTTYQTHRLFLVGHNAEGELSGFERLFDRPMGLHASADGERLTMATRYQIRELVNALPPGETHEGYDRVYVPRRAYTTGELDAHDLHRSPDGEIRFVNTQFSCVAAPSDTHSFRPVWTPPFISDVIPEDRCHLNGLATADGELRYATAVSQSDVAAGWRDRREGRGVVIDVQSGEIVADGLTMPHSPRLYDGDLYLINAGTGELGRVDRTTGEFDPIAFCPGFGRGLAFHDRFAVVGVSQPRRDRVFQNLPLGERLEAKGASPRCGLFVIDLSTGATAHWLTFTSIIEELYDVQVLPDVQRPMALGFKTNEIRRFITVEREEGSRRFLVTLQTADPSDTDDPAAGEDGAFPSLELPGGARQEDRHSARTADDASYRLHAGRIAASEMIERFGPLLPGRLQRRMAAGQVAADTPLLAVVAVREDEPVGVAAVHPTEASGKGNSAVLEALAVRPAHRGQGLGTALLERVEQICREAEETALRAAYRDDRSSQAALERVFEKRGWGTPRVHRHLYKAVVADGGGHPGLQRHELPDECTVFAWADLSAEERAEVKEHLRREEEPFARSPFQMNNRLESACSVGARTSDGVVGWMVTHRVASDVLQYTSLYVVPSMRRQGVGLGLIGEAARLQHEATDAPTALWTVEPGNEALLELVKSRLQPIVVSHARQLVLEKQLAGGQ